MFLLLITNSMYHLAMHSFKYYLLQKLPWLKAYCLRYSNSELALSLHKYAYVCSWIVKCSRANCLLQCNLWEGLLCGCDGHVTLGAG